MRGKILGGRRLQKPLEEHRGKPERGSGLDSGAYSTPVPTGCVREGRRCLCHGVDETASHTCAGHMG